MIDPASHVREHMEVVGWDGGHVGVVDKVENRRIKLTRNDPAAGGEHHYIHLDTAERVGSDRVHLDRTADRMRAEWTAETAGTVPPAGDVGAAKDALGQDAPIGNSSPDASRTTEPGFSTDED